MASPVLQFKRGLLANLPGLRAGEPGFTTDSYDLYVGIDSTTTNNKFFGSHRYWSKETSLKGSGVNLVEGTSNGSQYLTLKAPDSLSGIATYVFPDTTDGSAGDFLKLTSYTGNVYTLEWTAVPSGSFSIAGDTGTDTFTTGEVLTFTGGTNVGTAVTNNTVTFNLDDNINVTNLNASGITTLAGNITLGDNTSDNITVGGEFVSSLTPNATNTYDLGTSSQRWRNGWFSGNLTVAGIITATSFNDIFIENKDIILANTTNPNDTTANHGGVAVASTEGTPLFDISVAGINTLAKTYKQIMWVKSGTFTGLATDAWMFNYGVAIGTSTMGNGVRLAVGSGVSITDTEVYATTFRGSLVGTNASISGVTTTGTLKLTGTSGIGITGISTSTTLTENSDAYLPTQKAVKAYVDAVDLTTSIAGDTGTGSVSTSQTFTIAGTSGEIETSAASQTITVGLPDTVIVGTAVSTPTLKVATIQHRNGTQAATIDTSGNITASQNLTVSGNLYVNGSTTQVNSSSMTIEDRTIELGLVDGSTPSSTTTWDLGVLFNYNSSGAKKSAVFWEHADARFKFGSQVTDAGGTDNDSPQITVSAYAGIEIGSLWVNDCAGQSQVINCSGSTRTLENITIDAGSF